MNLVPGKAQKPFSFLYDVLYPACAAFVLIVLGAFTVFFAMGFNVNESRDIHTQTYDGSTDEVVGEWLVGDAFAFSVMQLIGIFLFCISLFALSYLFRMGFTRLAARLLHFCGTLLAFFIFFLALSGYIADTSSTFGTVMVAFVLVGFLYFICLGIKTVLKRPIRFISGKFSTVISRYIAPAIAICAFLMVLASILGLFLNINVKVSENKQWDPDADKVVYESFTTVITPLAPTINNYLRYLGTGAVLVAAVAVMFTKLPKVAKGLLNFVICSGGFILLWFIQLDFFHELDNMRLISIISFLAAYVVIFTAACITATVLRRKREKQQVYDPQFSGKRKK